MGATIFNNVYSAWGTEEPGLNTLGIKLLEETVIKPYCVFYLTYATGF